jgi:citrate lyase subunit beta/citryl-CoA lyase
MSMDAGPRGEAGRSGEDVRSDLHVTVEPGGAGLRIDLRSKVGALYGEAIRREAERTLAGLGVGDAAVTIEDRGALDYVVSARVEAAARAAGVQGGDGRPDRSVPLPGPTRRDRLRRSRLYLPGDQPKFAVNAGIHGPDAVILDLEDSVHPDHKAAARLVVRNTLRCVDFGGAEKMVRINQGDSGLADLDAVIPEGPDLVLLPKVEDPEAVHSVDDRIRSLTDRAVWLMPILESALGIERALEIARASERTVALTIGLEDYTADLGVVKTPEGSESAWARSRLVNAARAAGLQAIDSVYGDVADEAGLRAWAARAKAMGFEGMGCVHPRQIRPIHEAFAPTAAEIDRAAAIVAAFEEAGERGLGVVSLGSKMIDPPVVRRALRVVAHARAAGLLEAEEASDD